MLSVYERLETISTCEQPAACNQCIENMKLCAHKIGSASIYQRSWKDIQRMKQEQRKIFLKLKSLKRQK